MVQHGPRKKLMSRNAINMLDAFSDRSVNHIWNRTHIPMYNGYANAYHVMHRLDRIESMLANAPKLPGAVPKKHIRSRRGNIHTIHDFS